MDGDNWRAAWLTSTTSRGWSSWVVGWDWVVRHRALWFMHDIIGQALMLTYLFAFFWTLSWRSYLLTHHVLYYQDRSKLSRSTLLSCHDSLRLHQICYQQTWQPIIMTPEKNLYRSPRLRHHLSCKTAFTKV